MAGHEGHFVWYELITPDIAAARAFYEPLLEWKITDPAKPDEHAYYNLMNGDHNFGGAQTPPAPEVPTHWLGYIDVADVDATIERIKALGGSVTLAAMDIPDVGRIAVVADPSGAHFALYTPSQDYGDLSSGKRNLGNFGWAEVSSDDVEQSKTFYGECFNWSVGRVMEMGEGSYHMMMCGDEPVCGLFERPPDGPGCAWTFYVNVADADAADARCRELGGSVMENQVIPGMVHFAIMSDPQGAIFGVAASAE